MLTLKNLTVSIAKKKILSAINFSFAKGKVYAIMGPNGSGKSTLASSVMGHPIYKISSKSKILFEGKNIVDEPVEKRARKGIFLSFQSPIALTGVTVFQFMRYALDGKMDALAIRKKVQSDAKSLAISEDLLGRSLNEGFSGGERKKMEVLQAAMLDPKLIFFDEIDTGVDVDALRSISRFIKKMTGEGKTIVLITHYNRILKYIKPDKVLVLVAGKLIKIGDAKLAEKIEKVGYDNLSS